MKKNTIFPLLTVVIILVVIVSLFLSMSKTQNMIVVQKDNMSQKPMKIVLGKFQDSDCGMVINDIDYASQVISPSGKTWFFHDHGGMVNWISTKEFKDDAVIWVHSLDTNKWIDGRTAFYSRDEKTPMLYGFGAYENKTDKLISYDEMFLHMLRGEHLGNPSMQKNILKGSH